MQVSLYQTPDAGVSRPDSGCRSTSIRQGMQETLYQTADAGDSLSDSGCSSPIPARPLILGLIINLFSLFSLGWSPHPCFYLY